MINHSASTKVSSKSHDEKITQMARDRNDKKRQRNKRVSNVAWDWKRKPGCAMRGMCPKRAIRLIVALACRAHASQSRKGTPAEGINCVALGFHSIAGHVKSTCRHLNLEHCAFYYTLCIASRCKKKVHLRPRAMCSQKPQGFCPTSGVWSKVTKNTCSEKACVLPLRMPQLQVQVERTETHLQ